MVALKTRSTPLFGLRQARREGSSHDYSRHDEFSTSERLLADCGAFLHAALAT
jgi:hypothetical protein